MQFTTLQATHYSNAMNIKSLHRTFDVLADDTHLERIVRKRYPALQGDQVVFLTVISDVDEAITGHVQFYYLDPNVIYAP